MKEEWKKWIIALALICGLACAGSLAQAATINVPGDYQEIQSAISAAVNGDTVMVDDGTYVENLDFLGKAITVLSVNGAAATAIDGNLLDRVVTFRSGEGTDTILDGFTIVNGYGGIDCNSSSPTIMNCTVTGNSGVPDGGGIRCFGSSFPVIDGCTISDNTVFGRGGGLWCDDWSLPVVANCTISGNIADTGGGMQYSSTASPSITECSVTGNESSYQGGGLMFESCGSPTIEDCVIRDNTAHYHAGGGIYTISTAAIITGCEVTGNHAASGGGICLYLSHHTVISHSTIADNSAVTNGGGVELPHVSQGVELTNCVITGNTAGAYSNGGGLAIWSNSVASMTNCTFTENYTGSYGSGDEIHSGQYSAATLSNCIVWGWMAHDALGTVTAYYCDVMGGWSVGSNNIDVLPMFVGGGDYHLTSDSPCIDAGTPANNPPDDDIDGDARPLDGDGDNVADYDMGADEFVRRPAVTITTDKTAYTTGETMDVGIEIVEGSVPETADLFVRVLFPGSQPILYYPTWSTSPLPVLSSWQVTDYGPAVFYSRAFVGSEPAGTFTWQAAFTEPGTFNVIGDLSSASFDFVP